ncbi:hypothetical protein C7459_104239 [Tumebacillus permanentifrigoris]|uniref:Uncharacterized protein n=1 Tax=Tumebacillus permanentifrigoris TaxID=378543 RepID=A0A316DD28_9BACL|nr:hypothetical protein C7459_104239 [Tumebacillus permanentifrigoris]
MTLIRKAHDASFFVDRIATFESQMKNLAYMKSRFDIRQDYYFVLVAKVDDQVNGYAL